MPCCSRQRLSLAKKLGAATPRRDLPHEDSKTPTSAIAAINATRRPWLSSTFLATPLIPFDLATLRYAACVYRRVGLGALNSTRTVGPATGGCRDRSGGDLT